CACGDLARCARRVCFERKPRVGDGRADRRAGSLFRGRVRVAARTADPALVGSLGMEVFNHLAIGFDVALTWQNLVYCFIGCLLGTLVGVLPGIGPVATVAMLLPFTFDLGPAPALIMLAGIYYGAQYGG